MVLVVGAVDAEVAKSGELGWGEHLVGVLDSEHHMPWVNAGRDPYRALGEYLLRAHGNCIFPATTSAELRIVVGTSAVVALAAINVIALAAIVRRPAAAITVGAAVFLLPIIVAAGGGGAANWLLRLTPAAGLSMLQALTPVPPGQLQLHPRQWLLPALGARRARHRLRLRPLRPRHRDGCGQPKGRMPDAVRAEWTKLRTLPSTIWLLAVAAGVTVVVSAAAAAAWHVNPGSSAQIPPRSVSPESMPGLAGRRRPRGARGLEGVRHRDGPHESRPLLSGSAIWPPRQPISPGFSFP